MRDILSLATGARVVFHVETRYPSPMTTKSKEKGRQEATWSTGTRKPNRTQDAAMLVRMRSEDKELLERAATLQEADERRRFPGARLPVSAYVLGVALEHAREVLRKKKG